MRGAAALGLRDLAILLSAVAVLGLSARPASSQDPGSGAVLPESAAAPGDRSASPQAPDSTSAALAASPTAEPPGPDVRVVESGGVAEFLSGRPLARLVGSGGLCDRASLARGALPATMTAVVIGARRLDDRLTGGLAVQSARALSDGGLVVPSGPDLSVLPVLTASVVDGPVDLLARGDGREMSAVVVSPGRLPGPTPWARLSMGRGDLDWSAASVEFGRTYGGGRFGLSGSFERHEAGGPEPGGPRAIERGGLRSAFALEGGWRAELAARRFSLDRSDPGGSTPIEGDWIGSDVSLAIAGGRSRFEIFHTAGWMRSGPEGDGRSAESAGDGLSATVGIDHPPFDAVRLEVARVSADGSLLAGQERTTAFSGVVSGRLPLAVGSVALCAGGDWLGGRAVPVAAVTLSGRARGGAWSASAEIGGRHPTALERLAAPHQVPGDATAALSLCGNDGLDPERAVTLRAGCAWPDLLSGVGVTGEMARLLGPIALAPGGGGVVRPVNGEDELAGAASFWATAGDSLGVGARSTIDVFWMDDAGALVAPSPAPRATFSAAAWLTSRFFEDGFLEVRWELSLAHEVGLSRGPWEGVVDDAVTRVDASAAACAGPARFFLEVRDLLGSESSRVPGSPPDGRLIAAGFSASLWN